MRTSSEAGRSGSQTQNEESSSTLRSSDTLGDKGNRTAPESSTIVDASSQQGQSHRRRTSSLIGILDTSDRAGLDRKPVSPISEPRTSLNARLSQESKSLSRHDREDDEISTSEDVELEDFSDDGDDEEAGLTGQDRKQKRRRASSLGNRIAGADGVTAEEKKEADVHVMKNMLINCSLIALWYCFSLSISLVRVPFCNLKLQASNSDSITNGCFRQNISTSIFHYLRLADIWLSNSLCHHLYFCSCHDFALHTIQ